ncbi:hypothetical protein CEXT_184501 [Caerostris extrusa]|uniref:Secreted protein n=1 Tax=Caerostris extrusa TaxID=172846 RepID=A0AAV4VPI5_CAEEX|nr:hypothetical protein CEXT_184501 [Caerostris extrusa]
MSCSVQVLMSFSILLAHTPVLQVCSVFLRVRLFLRPSSCLPNAPTTGLSKYQTGNIGKTPVPVEGR